ncbi:Carbon-nitrogen hydrolase [seawater metagenome]|uniref:Carbon-nitrogen hydrolase n=1 Tax=seawater metagenome TaxID=1561972 RepID=A0A5E8CLG2_9ZZZZ
MKILVCQILVSSKKEENFNKIKYFLKKNINQQINIVVLPECWNSPYGTKYFAKYSEYLRPYLKFEKDKLEHTPLTYHFLKAESTKYPNVYFICGSIPEIDNNLIYNTCPIFFNGQLIDKYRKMNLYNIDLPGHQFRESDVLTPGDKPLIITTPWGRIGIGICFDLRFPDLAKYYRENKCDVIIYPGAFNQITGKKHWELLQRSRALDNMLFIVSCSVATNPNSDFLAWGHSTIVNPWGEVVNKLEEKEGVLIYDLNFKINKEIRQRIPIFNKS